MMAENFNHNGNEPDQQFNHENTDSNNLYAKQYTKEQEQLAQLEESAPQLTAPIDRGLNKKALAFIILAGFGLTGLGAFAYHQLSGTEEAPPPARAEVVTVPDLPQPEPVESQSAIPVSAAPDPAAQDPSQNLQLPPMQTAAQPNSINLETSPQPMPVEISQPSMPLQNVPVQLPAENVVTDDSTFVQDGEGGAQAQNTAVPTSNAVRYMHNKDKLLVQGTYLRCVLETKIISEIPGFTSCMITEPVYSASGKYLLLPKGSKVMGQYGPSNPTSGRMGVIWDRIITPDGVDVTLKSPGVDNLGAAGHEGKFKSHWPSRLASALLISMISDTFKYAAAEYGPQGETVTTSSSTISNPYESETADTLKQLAISQLERNNARPNTVTINQGSLINIYTAQDIDFSTVMQ
ncbi:TrbI/VirB10 family protein [Neisseria sp. CCUG12390]|uniref:TrbI/VirB10 family protein n=1 Tax=Neisseria sp. CCUG12390 TaxID=3392035 RepID=UPI003A100B36